jgi:hypothetical protein
MSVIKAPDDLSINERVSLEAQVCPLLGAGPIELICGVQEFILTAIKDADLRLDGRSCRDVRPVSVLGPSFPI